MTETDPLRDLERCAQHAAQGFHIFSPLATEGEIEEFLGEVEGVVKGVLDTNCQLEMVPCLDVMYDLVAILIPSQAPGRRQAISERRREFLRSLHVEDRTSPTWTDSPTTSSAPDLAVISAGLSGDRAGLRAMLKALSSFASLQSYQPDVGEPALFSQTPPGAEAGTLYLFSLCTRLIPPKPFLPIHLTLAIMAVFEAALSTRQKDVGIWGDYLQFTVDQLLRTAVFIQGQKGRESSSVLFDIVDDLFQRALEVTEGAVRPLCIFAHSYECVLTSFGVRRKPSGLTSEEAGYIVERCLIPSIATPSNLPDRPEVYECALGILARACDGNSQAVIGVADIAMRACHESIMSLDSGCPQQSISRWLDLFFDATDVLGMLGLHAEARGFLLAALSGGGRAHQQICRASRFGKALNCWQGAMLLGGEGPDGLRTLLELDETPQPVDPITVDIGRKRPKLSEGATEIEGFDYSDFMLGMAPFTVRRGVKGQRLRVFRAVESSCFNCGVCAKGFLVSPALEYPLNYVRHVIHSSASVSVRTENRDVTIVNSAPLRKLDPSKKEEPPKVQTNKDFLQFITKKADGK